MRFVGSSAPICGSIRLKWGMPIDFEALIVSHFGDPEFAEVFLSARRETAGVTASGTIKLPEICFGQRVKVRRQ